MLLTPTRRFWTTRPFWLQPLHWQRPPASPVRLPTMLRTFMFAWQRTSGFAHCWRPSKNNPTNIWAASCTRCGPVFLFAAHILESGSSMGRSYCDNDFSDREVQMNPDFYGDAAAISVDDTAASALPISVSGKEKQEATEEIEAPTVAVRFDGDGFAVEVDDEAESAAEEPVEAMPLPHKIGVTEWGSAFAEVHSRARNLENHSKVTAIRYIQSGSDKKISCLPSTVDFLADVQIVARKVLSPALYRVWQEIYWQGFGENAYRVPESVQELIQRRCGTAWKKAGLLPFHVYWHIRTKPEKLCAVSFEIVPDAREARNKRRRDRHAAARPVISVYAAAA